MIYFDNAATTMHKPETVIHAVAQALNSLGNAGRGAHMRRPLMLPGIFMESENGLQIFFTEKTRRGLPLHPILQRA